MTMGERLRELRKARGMTQTELADRLHTTKQTIGKYEQGIVTNLPLNRVEELAKALNTTPAYLMGWENEKGYTSNKARLIAEIENMSEEQAAMLLAAFQVAKASK